MRPAARGGWGFLVGPPLRARDISREQITPAEGLPALSLDALTSVAYGPEAIIAVLAVAGAGVPHPGLPVSGVIVGPPGLPGLSFNPGINAYPRGGCGAPV